MGRLALVNSGDVAAEIAASGLAVETQGQALGQQAGPGILHDPPLGRIARRMLETEDIVAGRVEFGLDTPVGIQGDRQMAHAMDMGTMRFGLVIRIGRQNQADGEQACQSHCSFSLSFPDRCIDPRMIRYYITFPELKGLVMSFLLLRESFMRGQDAIGIGLSGLCLVHCLALPVLISLGPALAWMENEWVHLGLAGLALVVTVNAMRSWPRRTTGVLLKTLALAGLGLLFFGALADIAELTERAVTVVGACMLALSHATAWYQVSRYGRLHQH